VEPDAVAADAAGGDAAAADAPTDAGLPGNLVFVTSSQHLPVELGGLDVADAVCAGRAAAAGLPGTYIAWLSTSAVAARDRLGAARGWRRVDGRPVADTVADLLGGRIFYPIRIDEAGGDAIGSTTMVTGTFSGGAGGGAWACADWSDPAGNYTSGRAHGTTGVWTGFDIAGCSVPGRLYCFGVDRAAPVAPTPATGRLAFASAWAPGGGLADADARCQADAAARGHPGTFRALLAAAGRSAASRFDPGGPPWVRVDGVPLAASAMALLLESTETALNVNAAGGYEPDAFVFSGAADPTTAGTAGTTCNDWTDAGAAFTALGHLADSGPTFFGAINDTCNVPGARIYCLAE